MGRTKIVLPTSRFVSKEAVRKLKSARSAMWKAPHTENVKRLKTFVAEGRFHDLKQLGAGIIGLKAVRDFRNAAAKTRGTSEGLANAFAETMKRYPGFKKQVAAAGKAGNDYLMFNAKGEPVLVKGDRLIGKAMHVKDEKGEVKVRGRKPFGIGRYRMQLQEVLDRAVPEYIEGKMGHESISFTRYGNELRIYNQTTGNEQKIEFDLIKKAEIHPYAGGKRKILVYLKDGSMFEIIISELADKNANEKMIKELKYWLEIEKR